MLQSKRQTNLVPHMLLHREGFGRGRLIVRRPAVSRGASALFGLLERCPDQGLTAKARCLPLRFAASSCRYHAYALASLRVLLFHDAVSASSTAARKVWQNRRWPVESLLLIVKCPLNVLSRLGRTLARKNIWHLVHSMKSCHKGRESKCHTAPPELTFPHNVKCDEVRTPIVKK